MQPRVRALAQRLELRTFDTESNETFSVGSEQDNAHSAAPRPPVGPRASGYSTTKTSP